MAKKVLAALGAPAAVAAGALGGVYAFVFAPGTSGREDSLPPEVRSRRPELQRKLDELYGAARKLKGERVGVRSRDALALSGQYFSFSASGEGPVILFFHGYHSWPLRDGCGMLKLAGELGIDVLAADQRAHGESAGRTITFGVRERYDCLDWIQYLLDRFGPDRDIILGGVSMGAATVLMAADRLPANVKGIIADCGYTSPEAIMEHVSRSVHIPPALSLPLLRASARILGGFDTRACSAPEALRRCRAPVLFIHGEADSFVPCDMSRENYAACTAPKRLLTVPGADHAMSFLVDEEAYTEAVKGFLKDIGC